MRWQVPLAQGDAEADLLDVDRPEALLDREPPRPGAVAGATAMTSTVAVAVLLDGDRGGEPRFRGLAARAEQAVRHRVVAAACPGQPDGEAAEFQPGPAGGLHPAAGPGGSHVGVEVHRDLVDGDPGVEQRTRGAAEPQPDPAGHQGRRHGHSAVRPTVSRSRVRPPGTGPDGASIHEVSCSSDAVTSVPPRSNGRARPSVSP